MTLSESVLYYPSTLVDDLALSQLSKLSFSNKGNRRLCLHESEESPLHIMLVESKSNLAFPRHQHLDGVEVMVIISGNLKIKLWHLGIDSCPAEYILSDNNRSKLLCIPKCVPHVTESLDGNVIYAEIKLGPYDPSSIQFV